MWLQHYIRIRGHIDYIETKTVLFQNKPPSCACNTVDEDNGGHAGNGGQQKSKSVK